MGRIFLHIIGVTGYLLWLSLSTAQGQSGIVVTKRSAPVGIVSFSTSSVLTGISNTKHVDGYVRKNGTTQFIFPVGDNGFYRPFAAAGDGTTGAYFRENAATATVPSGGPFSTSNRDEAVAAVTATEFWDINGSNATKITLSWNDASAIGLLTENRLDLLTIAGWNTSTSQWERVLSVVDVTSILGTPSALTSGSITTTASIAPDTYSIYTLAATPAGSLPVTLVNFRAYATDAAQVTLEWVTSREANSDRFTIQRSVDGKSWMSIGNVEAAGESAEPLSYQFIDDTPADGENLYRLKMIDRDGSFAFSGLESVLIEGNAVVLYPNPVSNRLFLKIPGRSDLREIVFRDLSGHSVFRSAVFPTLGIDVKNMSPGIYMVQIVMKNGSSTTKKILIGK